MDSAQQKVKVRPRLAEWVMSLARSLSGPVSAVALSAAESSESSDSTVTKQKGQILAPHLIVGG